MFSLRAKFHVAAGDSPTADPQRDNIAQRKGEVDDSAIAAYHARAEMAIKSGTDLVEEAKQRIREVTPAEAMRMHEQDPQLCG